MSQATPKTTIFNVVSAMEDYAVKHTRVATPNVVISDERIMETQERKKRKEEHRYINPSSISLVPSDALAISCRTSLGDL